MSRPLRLCLAGEGIEASPSPAMHNAALRACRIAGAYELRDLPVAELPAFVAELRSGRYAGCNVTIPHKAPLAAACDRLDGDAGLLGAVNTITYEAGRLIGDNTDVDGFELALSAQRLWPRPGVAAIVFGAGGAAAAVALSLSRVAEARIGIAARRPEAAVRLATRLAGLAKVEPLEWLGSELRHRLRSAGIVVNATPAGLESLPLRPQELPASCTVADVRYRPRPLDVVEAVRATGRPACDGLEMLLQQGMLSFSRWTGVSAPMAEARAALLAAVAA